MRVGAAAALVDGALVAGDVDVDERTGTVREVGLRGPGRGTVLPGLVDLQVNGFGGVDLRHAGPEDYAVAAAALAAHGAVAVQPTFYSCTVEEYVAALGVLGEVHRRPPPGCRLLGAHLEGPFLSPRWAGAHDPARLLDPSPEVLGALLAAGPVGMVTLAPELPGAAGAIDELVRRGVVVSVGHSDATAAQTHRAVAAGARHLTHCWNAHRRLTGRDPGPAGAVLGGGPVVAGLIADLVHVAPEVVRLTLAAAPGRVAATTDAVAPAGTAATTWAADGRRVVVADGAARLDDGTLVGGTATPDRLLAALVGLGIGLPAAVEALGGTQRRLLGLPAVRVRPGDPADLVVVDDELRPLRTLVGGRQAWPPPA